jgi:hypothetical protein
MVRVFLFIFFLKSLYLFSFEINKSIDKINIKQFNKYSKDSLPKLLIDIKKDSLGILPKFDSLSKSLDTLNINKDSLVLNNKKSLKKKKKKKKKLSQQLFEVKSMDSVTIYDYKIMYMDEIKKSVDTSLTIFKDYHFNFLREDYFELLPLPNMGEGFNRLGYNFHNDKITPDFGVRAKHFGYFEKEDIPYFNTPSAFTELFFKSTFDQGHHLDALVTLNTSPRFNFSIAYRGFRSLGSYSYSRSAASQFRFSSQYESYDKKYRLKLHHTSQKLENKVNGGLTNDSVYFFENSPNYAIVDPYTGEVEVDENGETLYESYGGFMDRTRLQTQINAENILSGKRYFVEQVYDLKPNAKNKKNNSIKFGHNIVYETKFFKFFQKNSQEYFADSFIEDNIQDRSNFKTLENNIFFSYSIPLTGRIKLNLKHINWNYFFENDDYLENDQVDQKIKENQFVGEFTWEKKFFGIDFKTKIYNSFKNNYSSKYYLIDLSKIIFDQFLIQTKYQFRSTPPNFNFALYQSDYIQYNWENLEFDNQEISTLTFTIEHPKWGYLMGEWNKLNKYTYFLNSTPLNWLNERFDITPTQQQNEMEYFKIKFFQNLKFGKFSFINTFQYQKVNQVDDPNLLFTSLALNVPEWITRSTIAFSSDLFNKALYIQTGFTFKFFTDYYADQYNPLIGEFVSQNNVKIGEYPMVNFFLNSKIQQTRVFLKIENLSGKIEHIINKDTKYDYYAAPYTPYRDFSIRFGLVWNFFQ